MNTHTANSHTPEKAFETVFTCARRLCAEQAPAHEIAKELGVVEYESPNKRTLILLPFDHHWQKVSVFANADGNVAHMELEAVEGLYLPATMFEAAFGEGDETTRTHWDAPREFLFKFHEGGYRCNVYGTLQRRLPEGEPLRFVGVILRRDGRVA